MGFVDTILVSTLQINVHYPIRVRPGGTHRADTPNHQEHAERVQWVGGHFDPSDVDAKTLAQAVHNLAKKWSRRPSARKPS